MLGSSMSMLDTYAATMFGKYCLTAKKKWLQRCSVSLVKAATAWVHKRVYSILKYKFAAMTS